MCRDVCRSVAATKIDVCHIPVSEELPCASFIRMRFVQSPVIAEITVRSCREGVDAFDDRLIRCQSLL